MNRIKKAGADTPAARDRRGGLHSVSMHNSTIKRGQRQLDDTYTVQGVSDHLSEVAKLRRFADEPSRIVCEVCGAFEIIPLGEQARRLDKSGNVLCSHCWRVFSGPIQTAQGTATHWGICDALFSFEWELRKLGMIDQSILDKCLRRAYLRMSEARYLTEADRLAMDGGQ